MMKKFLASAFASLFLLVSNGAGAAAVVASTNAQGSPGDTVVLNVSLLQGGDITNGGDFTLGFNSAKLEFVKAVGRSDALYEFLATAGDPFSDGDTFSLAYLGVTDPAIGPIDLIVSLSFLIKSPYNFPLSDVTNVRISGFITDANVRDVVFDAIAPTITVNAPANGIPEPGALALVGVALLIMVGTRRRRRVSRP